jgi:GLPGLI family protein
MKRFVLILSVFVVYVSSSLKVHAQIRSGTILFERKTNIIKKYPELSDFVNQFGMDKTVSDYFTLQFNDSISLYSPSNEIQTSEDMFGSFTENHSYLDNLNYKTRITQLDMGGEYFLFSEEIPKKQWKITDSKRKIADFTCRKAIWKKNDSTRIYAWFTEEIIPEIGPEGVTGLPGAILGLATENGSVVYFAQSVTVQSIDKSDIQFTYKKKKVMNLNELILKVNALLGEKEGKEKLDKELFYWR